MAKGRIETSNKEADEGCDTRRRKIGLSHTFFEDRRIGRSDGFKKSLVVAKTDETAWIYQRYDLEGLIIGRRTLYISSHITVLPLHLGVCVVRPINRGGDRKNGGISLSVLSGSEWGTGGPTFDSINSR